MALAHLRSRRSRPIPYCVRRGDYMMADPSTSPPQSVRERENGVRKCEDRDTGR